MKYWGELSWNYSSKFLLKAVELQAMNVFKVNPLSANHTEWSNKVKLFVGCCLRVA